MPRASRKPTEETADPSQTIADLQRELAQARAERDEALAQQQATAEVLGVINSSPGDVAPVFDAILDNAMSLCGAIFGELHTYDGVSFKTSAGRGHSAAFAEARAKNPPAARPGTASARILETKRPVHILDIKAEESYRERSPASRALIELGSTRTTLAVPLLKNDTVLGFISFHRDEVKPFTDKQIALLQNFAAQAVIAMENARLITETSEALERQTATAEVLGVINSSPGDLAPVFDAMLEKAMHLCEASFGCFFTRDGERFRFVAHRGLSAEFAEAMREPVLPPPGSALARIGQGEAIVQVADVSKGDAYRSGSRGSVTLVDIGGARTAIWVALRKEEALLGVFSIFRQEVRPFTDKQIALLQNFAAQAVIAMENARLLTETREALDQQTATAEVLGVINSSPGDLAPVFDAMLQKAHHLLGVDQGGLCTYDGEHFRAVATRGLPEDMVEVVRRPFRGNAYHQQLVCGERYIHIPDMLAVASEELDAVGRAGSAAGVRTTLLVPLRKDGALLGHISANRREVRPFSDKEIALLQNFAAQAVIAMENARLLTETREALEQQTATAEVLGVINSSPGNLVPVFDAMLEKALRLCGGSYGSLLRYDGERFHVLALVHADGALSDRLLHRSPIEVGPTNPLLPLVRGATIAFHENLRESEPYRRDALFREFVDTGGYQSVLDVALRKDGVLVGVIAVFRQETGPFTDKQIALLQNFAAQAVIAIENARLLSELRERNDEIAGWNQELEARVAAQLAEIERTGKLRRFLAPQLADLIVAQGDESILQSHRREIVVVFCDLRGFTGFAERAEPEEVMALLKDYHAAMGPIVAEHEGTIDHYGGDGIMVFFNDPVPTPDPARRAIDMAVAMRERAQPLLLAWRRQGHPLGFGVGIAQGYATLGQIGFAERMDYTAIGTVTNLAARLCAEAKDGQILIGSRVATAIEDSAELEEIGDLALKGLSQAVAVYNVPQ